MTLHKQTQYVGVVASCHHAPSSGKRRKNHINIDVMSEDFRKTLEGFTSSLTDGPQAHVHVCSALRII